MNARKPKVVPDATHPSMWRRRLMKKRGPSPVMSKRIFLGAHCAVTVRNG